MRQLNLTVDNEKKVFFIEDNSSGIQLKDIADEVEDNYDGYICLASLDNKLYELTETINYDCSIKFLDTNKLAKFDFYVDNSYLIEFDGIQHYRPGSGWNTVEKFEKTQTHDAFKN